MTIWDFVYIHEQKCEIVTNDDTVFRGILYLGDTEFDSSSGEDEVDIDTGKAYVCLPISHIRRVVLA